MKLSFLFIFALLAVGWFQVARSQECLSKNPFLPKLQARGVGIFLNPRFGDGHCSLEWPVHGTCCEVGSLSRYVERDAGNIGLFLNHMVKEIKLAAYSLVLFVNTVANYDNYDMDSIYKLKNGGIARMGIADFKQKAQELTELKNNIGPFISELKKIVQYLVKTTANFETVQGSCATRMNAIRSASVCSTCSGRSQIYFLFKKALISMETCTGFVIECFDSWLMLAKITTGLDEAREKIEHVRKFNPSINFAYKGQTITKMIEWMNRMQLKNHLMACKFNPTGCRYETKKQLCENMLTLEESTYLENTLEFLVNSRPNAQAEEHAVFSKRAQQDRGNFRESRGRSWSNNNRSPIDHIRNNKHMSETDKLVAEFDTKLKSKTLYSSATFRK